MQINTTLFKYPNKLKLLFSEFKLPFFHYYCKKSNLMAKIKVDTLISNEHILTINNEMTVFRNGMLAVSDDKISAVGNQADLADKYEAEHQIDAGGKILMPGFVNTHSHIAMTVFRGIADDIALHDWLYNYIFPLEKQCVTTDLVLKSTRLAILEMIRTGTTCFNDMYYFSDEIAKASKELGMRGIIAEGLIDFPTPNFSSPEEGLAYTEDLLIKYQTDDLINVAVGVHAPYTCSPDLIRNAKALSEKYKANYHIHLAETEWEFNLYREKHNLTPTEYLEKLDVFSDRFIAAHGIWLTDNDINILKKHNAGIAHNPECNMKIASGAARLPELLKAGVKTGLGTDGPASNNNLDMFQEMHTMALLHKFVSKDPTVIPAKEAVRIATAGGAEVLNMSDKIGSIEVGKQADFILIDTSNTMSIPMYDPYAALVYSLQSNSVSDTFISGKHLYKNHKFENIDTEKIFADVLELSEKIKVVSK